MDLCRAHTRVNVARQANIQLPDYVQQSLSSSKEASASSQSSQATKLKSIYGEAFTLDAEAVDKELSSNWEKNPLEEKDRRLEDEIQVDDVVNVLSKRSRPKNGDKFSRAIGNSLRRAKLGLQL